MRFDDLEFAPRFEYGEMAQVAGVCGAEDGTRLGAGWGRMTNAHIPWTIKYDEVLTVFEVPQGTELIYEAEYALVHFAIHPSNWHED
jgi:ethanolamine utilization protein EutQ